MTLRDTLTLAARTAFRRPLLSTVIVVTLAVGLGTITAAFSAIDAILLRPLAYPEPDRILAVQGTDTRDASPRFGGLSPADFLDVKAQSRSFATLAAYNDFVGTFQSDGEPLRVGVATVSEGMTAVLGIRAVVGRLFVADDYAGPVTSVVLTYQFWRSQFNGDAAAVGRTIQINGRARQIIGVLPDVRPAYPSGNYAAWSPMRLDAATATRGATFLRAVGRLNPGTSLATAQSELGTIARRLAAEHPQTNAARGFAAQGLHTSLVGPVRPMLLLLGGVLATILLIVCANVGNVLLASSRARTRELAVRAALGASGGMLARQLLAEALLLAALGGLLGLLAAPMLTGALRHFYPGTLPRADEMHISWRVVGMVPLATIATGVLASLPAIARARRRGLTNDLMSSGRGASERATHVPQALVVVQTAVAVVVLASSVLLLRTYWSLVRTDPGFRSEGILTFSLATPNARYASLAQYLAFYEALYARVQELPGVVAVGGTNLLPFAPGNLDEYYSREGKGDVPGKQPLASTQWVSPGYFAALGLRIQRGRGLTSADRDSLAPAVVVNAALAASAFPGEDPIGKRLQFRGVTWTIVGIAVDKRHTALAAAPTPEIYIPRAANGNERYSTWIAVRTTGDAATLVPTVRSIIRDLDPGMPVGDVSTMGARVADSIAPQRFRAVLVGGLAAMAFALAVLGVYGVVTDLVVRRMREMSIRMALGAQPAALVHVVMRRALGMVAIGLAAGSLAAVAAGRVLSSFLVDATQLDVGTILGVTCSFAAVSTLAALGPARRAAGADPIATMRAE